MGAPAPRVSSHVISHGHGTVVSHGTHVAHAPVLAHGPVLGHPIAHSFHGAIAHPVAHSFHGAIAHPAAHGFHGAIAHPVAHGFHAAPLIAHPVAHAVHAAPVIALRVPVVAHAVHAAPVYAPAPYVAPVIAHAAPVYPEVDEPYTYQYGVADDYSNANFNAAETADGNGVVTGSYSVALPDGRTQTVKYTSDNYNGYVADVTYEGVPVYPEEKHYVPAPAYAPAPAYHA